VTGPVDETGDEPDEGTMRRHTRLLGSAAAALALVTPTGCASDASNPDGMSPVDDPPGRTVARVDVDGDGGRDLVGYRVLHGDRVRISVRTGSSGTDRRLLDTGLWPGRGGDWHGVAPLDGQPGAELVVGTTMGAHTPLFTVLTMRDGRLWVQPSPVSGAREWYVDAFAGGYAGWTRTSTDNEVWAVSRTVFRAGSGRLWEGEQRRFRWGSDGWVGDGRRALRVRGQRAASRIGGWHVPGLPRWPSP